MDCGHGLKNSTIVVESGSFPGTVGVFMVVRGC